MARILFPPLLPSRGSRVPARGWTRWSDGAGSRLPAAINWGPWSEASPRPCGQCSRHDQSRRRIEALDSLRFATDRSGTGVARCVPIGPWSHSWQIRSIVATKFRWSRSWTPAGDPATGAGSTRFCRPTRARRAARVTERMCAPAADGPHRPVDCRTRRASTSPRPSWADSLMVVRIRNGAADFGVKPPVSADTARCALHDLTDLTRQLPGSMIPIWRSTMLR